MQIYIHPSGIIPYNILIIKIIYIMKKLYKTMLKDLTSSHKNFKWEVGKWYKTDGEIELCKNGFHASKNIIDAMYYVTPGILALVEVKGKHDIYYDKQCWEYMRIVKYVEWTKEMSVKLSVYSAELVIKNYEKIYPNDDRPRKAIEAAKNWLENSTKENESAAESAADSAWSAANSAAESAAESAADSAWSAALSARSAASAAESAWSAARSAARSAAWSAARSAAWSAANADKLLEKIHNYIVKMTNLK